MSAGLRGVYGRDLRRDDTESVPCAREIYTPQTPQTPQTAGQRLENLAGFSFWPKSLNRKHRNTAGFAGYPFLAAGFDFCLSERSFRRSTGMLRALRALRGHFRPPVRTRARGQRVTRNRGPWCRCYGMPAESTYCAHAEPTTSATPPSPRPSSSRCGEPQDSPGTRPRYGPRGWRRAGAVGSALRVQEGITSLIEGQGSDPAPPCSPVVPREGHSSRLKTGR
jgi:hypothetical protein